MIQAEGLLPTPNISLPPTQMESSKVDGASSKRVKEMAKEFEATLLSMMLKEMRESQDPEGGIFPGDTGDVQGGLFDMFMSRHLAAGGGIGLAAFLERNMPAK